MLLEGLKERSEAKLPGVAVRVSHRTASDTFNSIAKLAGTVKKKKMKKGGKKKKKKWHFVDSMRLSSRTKAFVLAYIFLGTFSTRCGSYFTYLIFERGKDKTQNTCFSTPSRSKNKLLTENF